MTAPIPREHFLPANSTKLEVSLSEAGGRIDDIGVPIDILWSWDKCPVSHLPWLAWAFSVDFWNDKWPESRKRLVIREAFEVHQIKGTLDCVGKYLDYADAELIEAFTPPQDGFLGELDDDFINSWRESLPQIHIRPYVDNGVDYSFYLDTDFLDDGCLDEHSISSYVGREAFYVHEGVETPVSWIDGAGPFTPRGVERFGLKGIADWGAFYLDDGFLDGDFYLADESDVLSEIVSLERAGLAHILTAGYQATRSQAEIIPITYFAHEAELFLDDGFLDDGALYDTELMPEFAEKFYLYIPEKFEKAPADMFAYVGVTRFGADEYTAELKVKINDTTDDRFSFFLDDGFLDEGFITDPNLSDLWRACDAIVMAKSKRDDVFIDTVVKHPVTLGDGVNFGDLVLGKFI